MNESTVMAIVKSWELVQCVCSQLYFVILCRNVEVVGNGLGMWRWSWMVWGTPYEVNKLLFCVWSLWRHWSKHNVFSFVCTSSLCRSLGVVLYELCTLEHAFQGQVCVCPTCACRVPSPGHPSAADVAWYWLKRILRSGWLCITSRPFL